VKGRGETATSLSKKLLHSSFFKIHIFIFFCKNANCGKLVDTRGVGNVFTLGRYVFTIVNTSTVGGAQVIRDKKYYDLY
jgi:hypothetical protein